MDRRGVGKGVYLYHRNLLPTMGQGALVMPREVGGALSYMREKHSVAELIVPRDEGSNLQSPRELG